MRTNSIVRFGGPDVLTMVDKSVPTPGENEVAIDVVAAGVNFAEILYRRGIAPHVALPFTPGIEVAGIVRAVGAKVFHLSVGQRVAALTIVNSGGYAEVAVTHAALAVPIPEALDWHVAAGMPSNATTAVMVLRDLARLQPGERVAIHAAAGGVCGALRQVDKLLGAAHVTGTVGSSDKIAYARQFGFDDVVAIDALADRNHALAKEGFDLIVDPVGGDVRTLSIGMLKPGGRLVAMGNASDASAVQVSSNDLWLSSKSVLGFNLHLLSATYPERVGQALLHAVEHVVQNRIRIDVTQTLPLEEAAQAHRKIEARQSLGKLVLDVANR